MKNLCKKFKTDFIVFIILFILYFQYIPAWIKEWTNFDSFYSFFPFLVIFAIQFFRIKVVEFKKAEINPANFGILFVIAGGVMYFAGVRAEIDLLSALSLPLLISGIILFFYGIRIFVLSLPIIILLSLSIPVIPIFRLTVPLQIFLADITGKIFNVLSINAYNLGSSVYIGKYLISIDAGCIGVRSLSSLLIVSFMLFYFKSISVLKKALIILLVLILSFIGNLSRIVLTGLYIIYNGMNGTEVFHYYAGLIIFILSLAVILVMNEFIEDDKVAAI